MEELIDRIRDVRVGIWDIKSNLCWMNYQLEGVLEVVCHITMHTSGSYHYMDGAEGTQKDIYVYMVLKWIL